MYISVSRITFAGVHCKSDITKVNEIDFFMTS